MCTRIRKSSWIGCKWPRNPIANGPEIEPPLCGFALATQRHSSGAASRARSRKRPWDIRGFTQMDPHATPATSAAHGHEHHELNFLRKYIFSEDHKIIGIQFLFTSIIF